MFELNYKRHNHIKFKILSIKEPLILKDWGRTEIKDFEKNTKFYFYKLYEFGNYFFIKHEIFNYFLLIDKTKIKYEDKNDYFSLGEYTEEEKIIYGINGLDYINKEVNASHTLFLNFVERLDLLLNYPEQFHYIIYKDKQYSRIYGDKNIIDGSLEHSEQKGIINKFYFLETKTQQIKGFLISDFFHYFKRL